MKNIAHLNAVRAFEASARHLSFSLAAKELNVTPAAIGQQVRLLEEWLEVALFIRATSGISRLTLTEQAKAALPEISLGLEHISQGLALLQKPVVSNAITVSVSPAFAAKWLLMHIDDFQLKYPDYDLRLNTNSRSVDYFAEDIDIGVRYGKGNWSGLSQTLLMDEDIFPVCSPDLIESGLSTTADLVNYPLLHDHSMPLSSGFPSWESWLETQGITHIETNKGLKINNSASVIQAAVSGQGVALGRSVLVKDDLACGRLVKPFPQLNSRTDLAYYIVWRPEHDGLEKVQAFKAWLLDTVSAR
ncbi:transcriptional regulator GcvA [Moritella sp. 24]|uniref:transcriptional regulator GcvA n=1 Tax=Moritella sp. 24 TaxID=2746230 RepID=UPI001BAD22C4|nr:transcriptional regulator GcvA [Moritella sp. 24]QUM76982.1 transcriptional regulator GcvA [Moritella sp. 24]